MSRITSKHNDTPQFAEVSSSDFFYHQALCGFISFLPNGDVLRINQTFCKWLGLTEAEVYSLKFNALLTKADELYYRRGISALLKAQGFVEEINFCFVCTNGNLDTLFNAVVCLNEAGELIAINATVQKISSRKIYERELLKLKQNADEEKQKLEYLSHAIPNMIFTALPDGEVNFINQRFKDYFNYTDYSQVKNGREIFADDRAGMRVTWGNCLLSGRQLYKEVRLQGKDKNPEWFLVTAEPFYNEEGNIELWFGSFTSIHKQKLLQLANYSSLTSSLHYAHKTIDKNNDMFIKIALSQSHMIRKPLANILGLISLLAEIPASADAKDMIGLLNISAIELDDLIKEVVANASH